jgi:catechol 2,3-dioxygenase-like lactoylglutathione lyase family enzyme
MPKSLVSKKTASRSRRAGAAKKAAITRKRRVAGRRAAITKKRRAAAAKARTTRKERRTATIETRDDRLSRSNIVAFLATADSQRARTFYESVLGLRLVADEPFALVFDGNGVMVRIQKVDAVTPAAYTALGWHVADVAATIRGLTDRGAELERFAGLEQDDLGVWRSPSGARVAWLRDPDGNVLSITEW